jgi:hypothetical protein
MLVVVDRLDFSERPFIRPQSCFARWATIGL